MSHRPLPRLEPLQQALQHLRVQVGPVLPSGLWIVQLLSLIRLLGTLATGSQPTDKIEALMVVWDILYSLTETLCVN